MSNGTSTIFPPGTYVNAGNWGELKGDGAVWLTNVDDPALDPSGDKRDPTMTLRILEWELGVGNVCDGDPLFNGLPTHDQADLPSMRGMYGVLPAPDWTNPCERWVDWYGPEITAAGLTDLLEGDDEQRTRWQMWSVFGNPDLYRCWGPATTWGTRFEGTFDEVVAHIKAWEAEHGHEYPS